MLWPIDCVPSHYKLNNDS